PKDNVMVMPGWKLSIIGTFADYGTAVEPQNSYMYHCHILPHEDKGMMGQFVVTDVLTSVKEVPALSDRAMKVFPNPAEGYIFLEGGSQAESWVRFSDLNGRTIKTQKLGPFEGAVRINIDELSSGLFLVEWLSEEGKAVTKLSAW
ncbi:MAG: T9SS type A sorting domain-containing protein, partial [Bacteroidota bacterium]